jgi:hypothetical protein
MSFYEISNGFLLEPRTTGGNVSYLFTSANNILLIEPNTTSNKFQMDQNANITINGTYNGVTIQSHASRHQPGGADPIPTATAVSITEFTNSEGVSTSLARSDHQHAHGALGGGNLHALATTSENGFMSSADKVILDNATDQAIVNTLVKRNATDASTAFGDHVDLVNTSTNRRTRLQLSPNIVGNYDLVFPTSGGTLNQSFASTGTGSTFWLTLNPTTTYGDMIVQGANNLEALTIPQPPITPNANLQYVLSANASLFPTWVIPPFAPATSFVEVTDFTGAVSPFSETNWRSSSTASTTITDAVPTANVGNPIGCVSLTLNATATSILLTKASTSNTNTLSFATNSTVYFESAVNADLLNANVGTVTLEMGFSNALTSSVAPTQFVAFQFPSTGTNSTSPLNFVNSDGGGTTTFALPDTNPNTWYRLRFIVYGRTQLMAYVNDSLVYTQNPLTTFPAEATLLSPYVRFARTGATNRTAVIDYVHWGKFLNTLGRYS